MVKLSVYNFVSANGCYKGANEDISWAHQNASEEVSVFAVASEYFFEQPHAFRANHPELHEMLERIYRTRT